MGTFTPASNTTNAPNVDAFAHSGTVDVVTVNAGVTLKAQGTSSRGVFLDGHGDTLNVNGNVTSEQYYAVLIGDSNDADSGNNTVTVGATGAVRGDGDEDAIHVYGSGNLITNIGVVSGKETGLDLDGDLGTIKNSGFVQAGTFGIQVSGIGNSVVNTGYLASGVFAVTSGGNNSKIANSGFVTGGLYALAVTGETATVTNSGTVAGAVAGVFLYNSDGLVNTVAGTAQIINSGTISGGYAGIAVGSDKIAVINKAGGLITTDNVVTPSNQVVQGGAAHSTAVSLSSNPGGTITFHNAGTVQARTNAVLGGGGTEKVTNSGKIIGAIDLAGGNDTYDGHKGTVSGTVAGGAGADKLIAGKGHETFAGGTEDDRFVFNSAAAAGKGKARDKITDFSHAEHDKINLSGIDADANHKHDQDFTFIGDETFKHYHKDNPGDVGLLRFHHHVISGDVDGDLHADFSVAINTAVVKGDFLL